VEARSTLPLEADVSEPKGCVGFGPKADLMSSTGQVPQRATIGHLWVSIGVHLGTDFVLSPRSWNAHFGQPDRILIVVDLDILPAPIAERRRAARNLQIQHAALALIRRAWTEPEPFGWQSRLTTPYINVVAVKCGNTESSWAQDIVAAYKSQAFKTAILSDRFYDGFALPDYLK